MGGQTATWLVTSTDTAYKGAGLAEFVYTIGDQIAKSVVFNTTVLPDIGDHSETPPDPYEDWLDTLIDLADEVVEANKTLSPETFVLKNILCPDFSISESGRTYVKESSNIKNIYSGSASTEKVVVNLTGIIATARTQAGGDEYITSILDDLADISWVSSAGGFTYLKGVTRSTYTGANLGRFVIQYVKVENETITKVSSQKFDLAGVNGVSNLRLSIPEDATHFAFYIYTDDASAEFDCVFTLEFVPFSVCS